MTIDIKGTPVTLKQTLRAAILYENIQGKSPDKISNLTDTCIYIYCTIISSDKNLELTFDEYLELVDEDPTIITKFVEWISEVSGINNFVSEKGESKGSKKKLK